MTSSNKPTEFSDLSKELRLMIWDLTLSARLLTFSLIGYPSIGAVAPAHTIKSKHRFILQEVTSPPALAICSESRNLALRLGYKPSSFTVNSDTGLIWNPKLDIIWLPSLWGFYTFEFFQKCFPSESKEVQRLQLSSEMIWPQREMTLSPIVGFENLKMIIVLHSEALDRGAYGPVRIEYRKLPRDRREIEARIAQFWPQWTFPEIKVVGYSDEILDDA